MNCQTLYDLRDQFGFCSEMELQEWFKKTLGRYLPSGKIVLSKEEIQDAAVFVSQCIQAMKEVSPIALPEIERREKFIQCIFSAN